MTKIIHSMTEMTLIRQTGILVISVIPDMIKVMLADTKEKVPESGILKENPVLFHVFQYTVLILVI